MRKKEKKKAGDRQRSARSRHVQSAGLQPSLIRPKSRSPLLTWPGWIACEKARETVDFHRF